MNINKKIKIIEIAQKLKNNSITEQEGFKEINDVLNPKIEHCYLCEQFGREEKIEKTSIEYPDGLPLDTLDITYCNTCGHILETDW